MSKGMYYTPKEILDPAVGTGAYLKNVAELLVSNPPYSAEHSVQRMGGTWRNKIISWWRRVFSLAHR